MLLESPASSDVDSRAPRTRRRGGTAAVEFAVCLPWIMFLLFGIWEVGRMVEVNQVMWGATREGARQCSVGSDNIQTITTNVLVYLMNAEPNAFNIPAGTTITLTKSGSTTVTVVASNGGSQVCTMKYQNITHPSQNDPTTASQNDKFMLSLSLPYHNIAWVNGGFFMGDPTLSATVYWYSLIDTPIVVNPTLPVG